MTSDPHTPEDRQADAQPSRRRSFRWFVGAGVVLAVAVFLWWDTGEAPAGQQDLSTPKGAAESFARAAATGDVDGLIATTCLGHEGCAAQHGGGVTADHISAAKEVIVRQVREIGARFGQAEFTSTRAGELPGTKEVAYRLPGMPEGERSYLVFVEYQNRWLYIGTGGGS